MSATVYELAEETLRLARGAGLTIATVESCTGGLVAGALTEVPGSSDVVDRGFVTYSNAAKTALVGVPAELIEAKGAVSEEVAVAMAEGALAAAGVGLTVAITGVAGPGGGSEDKPVGLVHFAAARLGRQTLHRERRFGDLGRAEIRRRSVIEALEMLQEASGATGVA
ncbi:CinA family protein [Methylopila sp. Yamaguchi]|uniref:CinA family protein n=1 Tax=Methylopila sp. Yamaguchi TaxID=1437817 RepID=UPI000CCAE0D5|nr:nicotinamide-nucleotide amidohydrolase family protein [Methylopila sp. Yamaguchi]GBD47263.1 CinA domain-containing protein [Methylopila sp. Yamaguchi]